MIDYIKGDIASLNPATVTIETSGGVGYLLNITLPTYTALDGHKQARLLVHESIREDAWVLYGFLEESERELFRALVGVSGVGASSARMILSAIPASDLRVVIASADAKSLKAVKGVGAKTAERIIVDLKDKVKVEDSEIASLQSRQESSPVFNEALEALVILGFQRQTSHKTLKKLFADNPSLTVEAAIKKAMALL